MKRKRIEGRVVRASRRRVAGSRSRSQGAVPVLEALQQRVLLSTVTVNSALDGPIVDGDGQLTLREAIVVANADDGATAIDGAVGDIGADTIVFSPSLGGARVLLTEGPLVISSALAIDAGALVGGLAIDARGTSRVLLVDDGSAVTLAPVALIGVSITGGQLTAPEVQGGGILNREDLTLTDSTVVANRAVDGAGIYSAGSLTITRGAIERNVATDVGGGIAVAGGNLTVSAGTVAANTALDGGGIHNDGGEVTLRASTISGNTAAASGGGIYTYEGGLRVAGSMVSGNTAEVGGGIYSSYLADVVVTASTIADNVADGGGGIYNAGGLATITRSTISGNTAHGSGATPGARSTRSGGPSIAGAFPYGEGGGGILNVFGVLMLEASTISGNTSGSTGGGIGNAAGNVSVNASTITDNTAYDGGGVSGAIGNMTFRRSTISGNTADGIGGGLAHFYGNTALTESTVSDNTAAYGGGGIAGYGGALAVTASTISGNDSGEVGGGISHYDGHLTLSRSTISGNTASYEGGGIYAVQGRAVIEQSTITGNRASYAGGGVAAYGDTSTRVTVSSSIIAANAGADVDVPVGEADGVFVSEGHNVIGFGNAAGAFAIDDQTDVSDPLLAPLAGNGGPTWTHALLPGSPALDAGVAEFHVDDQRGLQRTVDLPGIPDASNGDGTDVGAFEAQSAPVLEVVAVQLSGSSWAPGIGPHVPGAGVDPVAPLPWPDLDTVQVVFNVDVNIVASSLVLTGVNVARYGVGGFAYDALSRTATWALDPPVSADRLRLNIAGEAADPAPVSIAASGSDLLNGGSDFEIRLDVLAGDVNGDGVTSVLDIGAFRALSGEPVVEGQGPLRADLNADGVVDPIDAGLLRASLGRSLPAGEPGAVVPPSAPARAVLWVAARTASRPDATARQALLGLLRGLLARDADADPPSGTALRALYRAGGPSP